MAGTSKLLDVPWFCQETPHFCGPAVAQMFLGYNQVAVEQTALWDEIKANSAGTGNGPTELEFPTQVCDDCGRGEGGTVWECWDTTPEALQQTITPHLPAVPLSVHYAPTFEAGTTMLIESLDRTPAVPPFATLYSINHWVLVNGYLRDDLTSTEFPATQVGPYQLNGLYILDPQQVDPVERVRLIAMTKPDPASRPDWSDQFGLLVCGPNVDRHPLVVGNGGRPVGGLSPWVLAAISAVLLLFLVWWLVSD